MATLIIYILFKLRFEGFLIPFLIKVNGYEVYIKQLKIWVEWLLLDLNPNLKSPSKYLGECIIIKFFKS